MQGAADIADAGEMVNFHIDPTRGQLLALLVQGAFELIERSLLPRGLRPCGNGRFRIASGAYKK